jgi:hypothetical protein
MSRRKKKKPTRRKEPKNIIAPEKKPEDFLVADSAIWWEANPDKSKKYGNKEYKGKKTLTPKEAEKFLGVTGYWLGYFIMAEKGFPKLPYDSSGATIKFKREDLVQYRNMLRTRKFYTKARPQQ